MMMPSHECHARDLSRKDRADGRSSANGYSLPDLTMWGVDSARAPHP